MFQKISTSYALVKTAFACIAKDWELLVYSLLSILSSLCILATFFGIDFFFLWNLKAVMNDTNQEGNTREIILLMYSFVYYLIFSFITFFFNTAIITSVQRRIRGEENAFWDGMRDALQNWKQILIWSSINALVTTLLNALQRYFGEDSFIGSFIISLIGWVWNVLTFFAFPLMILGEMWPKEAIKESASLFKNTWGERAILQVGVGLFFFLAIVLWIILSILVIINVNIIFWIILLVWGLIFWGLLSATCDVIIKTILLHYAQTQTLPKIVVDPSFIDKIAGEKK